MTRLWRAEGQQLREIATSHPRSEANIEAWVAENPGMLGLDLLIIGRQVQTDFGGRIDLIGMDAAGDLTLIEVKRDRTPRDVIAQTLDYGSWIRGLTTGSVHALANQHLKRPLSEAFRDTFGQNLPDVLNSSHNLLIVASSFDSSSRRIVEYLAEAHGVSINTAFFTYFNDGEAEYLAADFLMDQEQVVERAVAKTKAPWSGYYYVNAGHGPHRDWEDMRKYGFVAAGHGRFYSGRLNQLAPGDPVFVYQKGHGYVGYGKVTAASVPAQDFLTADGRHLAEVELRQPKILEAAEDPEMAEYAVGVAWEKTLPIADARWLDGGFANQNIVCKLRDPATLDFLIREFGVETAAQ